MAPKKKQKKEEVPTSLEGQFEKQLELVGLADALQLADEVGTHYEVIPTRLPSLNELIGGRKLHLRGWPKNVHAEVFSEEEHVGKTGLSLEIGIPFQLAGLRVGVIDIEPSITLARLKEIGYITGKEEAEKRGLYAVRLMQPKIKPEECETDMIYVEKILDTVSAAANLFDLLIIDSVDALISETDAEKPTEDGQTMGGVAKPIKGFFRKNTLRRASIIWINHMSKGLGQYAPSYTTGGKAIGRYSSLRIKITRTEILREKENGAPYGFKVKLETRKNRISGEPFCFCFLYFIYGEGFSADFDYYMMAQTMGIITKSSSWMYVGDKEDFKLKGQGLMNLYYTLRDERRDVLDWIKSMVDGEEVSVVAEMPETDKAAAALEALIVDEDPAVAA